ncbi:hypothetical protein Tco_0774117 [Tanacetum coccineum]|uniref:Integrase catalytic domain-containing protein n=1 Tax=Tanacetum coccineum TaxID=301880 RepID=A0ABQ4ZPU1_9ASTR
MIHGKDRGSLKNPVYWAALERYQIHDESNVYDNVRRHSEQPESINDTYVLEKDDSNVTPDSSNICTNDNQVDQNAVECVDERDALANLIANLTLDTEENKMILKQLKKANASLTQELKSLDMYNALLDRTFDYEILQTKLNETLGLLALKDIEIKEGLKTKAYEISVLDQKHDDLVKKSLLTKSQLEGYLKENTKVISDLKVKEEKDIDKMIEMDKQLKFLNEIVYTRNQSIQTIHMLAPKCATYNGRLTFANPRYLKKAQSEKPCLYEIPYDNSDHANRFAPEREETMTLENESRSKLNKDTGKPYGLTNRIILNDVNARNKKPNVVPISDSKPKRKANKSVATLHKKIVASDTTIQKSKNCTTHPLFIVDSGAQSHMTGIASCCVILWMNFLIHLDSFSYDPKDETPEVLNGLFYTMILSKSSSSTFTVRNDRGTEFLNKDTPVIFKEKELNTLTYLLEHLIQNGRCRKTEP